VDLDEIIEITRDFALAVAIVTPIAVVPVAAIAYFGERKPQPDISEKGTPNISVPFRVPIIPPM
jgi:hypothetical protein